ncbi:MAG: Uma2 family endonuclease [Acidobacteria bacterium]|jgi:Uma2 family endonuclease|nr:Uma2 family endonuclease [Acidobacteriota bacterium]
MSAVLEKTKSIVLHNISWNAYKQITDSLQDETPAHFTFDRGKLEIMVLSLKHENFKKILAMLFERLSEAFDIEIFAGGSTTFQREDLERGFEPDECYYVQNIEVMRGKDNVDLAFDPPPDLTIEVDVKHSSLNRMSIFSAIGIHEVWRYDGEKLIIYLLRGDKYQESETSSVLPLVTARKLTQLVEMGRNSTRRNFLLQIKEYTNELK